MSEQFLESRQEYAQTRLTEVRKAFDEKLDRSRADDLCVYVTGSYARMEAAPSSDLDLFFVCSGSEDGEKLSVVESSLLNSSVINVCRQLDFPEFSKGGEYLSVHYLKDILKRLGSPRDDYLNHFTARMLLLLESKCLFNDILYAETIDNIINAYWADYHEHEKDFRPIFLVNDILRFWRTLCLNYEHNRDRLNNSDEKKRKAHLKNLKLKFSRMLTCYWSIMEILSVDGAVGPGAMTEIVQRTPMQRIMNLAKKNLNVSSIVDDIIEDYSWFLEVTGRSEEDVLKWIGDKKKRDKAFSRARKFGRNIHKMIEELPFDQEKMRYLVV